MKPPSMIGEEINLQTFIDQMVLIHKEEINEQDIIATICHAIYTKMLPAEFDIVRIIEYKVTPFYGSSIPDKKERKSIHESKIYLSALEDAIDRKETKSGTFKKIILKVIDVVNWSKQTKTTLPSFYLPPEEITKKRKQPPWASKAIIEGKKWYQEQQKSGTKKNYDDIANYLAKNQKELGITQAHRKLDAATIRRDALIGSGIIQKTPKNMK